MKYKVVLIDDNLYTLKSIRLTVDWDLLGFEVLGTAYDGETGLTLIEQVHPDVVITDIQMPKLDGLALVEKGKKLLEDALVIVITGFDRFQYASRAIKLSVFDYILKPVNNEELYKSLSRAKKKLDEKNHKTEQDKLAQLYHQRIQMLTLMTGNGIDSHQEDLDILSSTQPYFIMVISTKTGLTRPILQRVDDFIFPEGVEAVSAVLYGMLVLLCKLQDAQTDWRQYAERITKKLGEFIPEYIIGVSSLCRGLACVRLAYQEAESVMIESSTMNFVSTITYYNGNSPTFTKHSQLAEMERICHKLAERFEEMTCEETGEELMRLCKGKINILRIIMMMYATRVLQSFMLGIQWNIALDTVVFDIAQLSSEDDARRWLDQFYSVVEKSKLKRDGMSQIVYEVLVYIKSHSTEGLKLEDVARNFYVSPNHLSSLIRKETGKTYQQHFIESKMEIAKQLLDDTRMNIKDIAHAVSYENYISFYNVFKKNEGMTPTEWRFRKH